MAAGSHRSTGPDTDPDAYADLEEELGDLLFQVFFHAVIGAEARANNCPLEISSALIGSCTNSSYEDITRAASIARHASAAGLMVKTPLLVSPGSEQIRATIERELAGPLDLKGLAGEQADA